MEMMDRNQRDLPNATTILVLGILSLVFCWCYGIIGLVLGIITVVMSGSQRKLYLGSPSEFTESSCRNVNSGRVCGIVAICISAFIMLIWILLFCGIFTMAALSSSHLIR